MRVTLSPSMLTAQRPMRTVYAAKCPVLVAAAGSGLYRLLAGPLPVHDVSAWRLDDPKVVAAIESYAATTSPASRLEKMH